MRMGRSFLKTLWVTEIPSPVQFKKCTCDGNTVSCAVFDFVGIINYDKKCMRKFATNQYYHVFNRGKNHEDIFTDRSDYDSFYKSLFLFNDINYKNPSGERLLNESLLATINNPFKSRKPLVNIISFSLLPNHFHLMLEQIVERGISIFLHKICMSHAKYFNKKYSKSGPVFSHKYKSVNIQNDEHFNHLPRYIHLNCLDLQNFDWRNSNVCNWKEALCYMNEYEWSSHDVYMKKGQRLPVVDEESANLIFKDQDDYILSLKDFCCGNDAFDQQPHRKRFLKSYM